VQQLGWQWRGGLTSGCVWRGYLNGMVTCWAVRDMCGSFGPTDSCEKGAFRARHGIGKASQRELERMEEDGMQ
jgi:hypothetical protein